jgi:hypothetical protein
MTQPPLYQRSRDLNFGSPAGFLHSPPARQAIDPRNPSGIPITLYAVIGTWFEADIIEATVRNCFVNGCSKVFIVDNASPDDTCAVAERAGAVIARTYQTDYYDEDYRLRIMNEVMQEATERDKHPCLWWLSLDADELPCGPHGEKVIDYLATIDANVNCIGANAIDLYPTEPPYYVPGKHPADCMDKGMWRRGWHWCCATHHWKHPLLRQDNGFYGLGQGRGSHQPFRHRNHGPAIEPHSEIVMFHAPLRSKEIAVARLNALCVKKPELGGNYRSVGDDHNTGGNGAIKRWRSLEHIYAGEWDRVELPHAQAYGRNITGISLYPWRRLLKFNGFPRWYEAELKRMELPLIV